jgi:cytochrome c oxidase cbb3-type subunit III
MFSPFRNSASAGLARDVVFAATVSCALLVSSGCEREERAFNPGPVASSVAEPPTVQPRIVHYEKNAYALAAGKRLWGWYNCAGCHANGGGAVGPALTNGQWTYGGDESAIYASIADGRPNGMPAFRGRLPEDQLWQLAAYVRSLGGLAPQDAAPNRNDAFLTRTPESFADSQPAEAAVPRGTRTR